MLNLLSTGTSAISMSATLAFSRGLAAARYFSVGGFPRYSILSQTMWSDHRCTGHSRKPCIPPARSSNNDQQIMDN
eukprot:5842171-Amphidinium_carterae.1